MKSGFMMIIPIYAKVSNQLKNQKTVYMVNNTHNKQHSFVVLLSEPLGLFKLHHGLGKTRYLGLKRKIMNNAKGLI